jgi:hypothetical protein
MANGLSTLGIFRREGTRAVRDQMVKRIYPTNDLNRQDFYSEHCLEVSWLIKHYLTELPESLLTRALTPLFLKADGLGSEPEKIQAIKLLLLLLPKSHLVLFECIIDLAGRVFESHDLNQMTLEDLARMLSGSLIKYDGSGKPRDNDRIDCGFRF